MSEGPHLIVPKLRKAAAQVQYLPRALGLVWAAARGWTAGWVGLLAVQGVLPLATVYLTRALVDGVVGAVRAGGEWSSVRPVLGLVAPFGWRLPAALFVSTLPPAGCGRINLNWCRITSPG